MENHTPDFLEHERRIRAAMDEFASDIRHIRFVESSNYNWVSMQEYLGRNDMDVTDPENLHLAYETLVRDHQLELLPLGHVQETPQPEPAPVSPATAPPKQTFMWRNGQPISGNARSL
jgi:hypothetical protein